MYAIIKSGGKQCRVSEGDVIQVERLEATVGNQVSFDEVLFVSAGDDTRLGTPAIAGARVLGTVTEQGKAGKILVFKYKRRKKYRRIRGHRQLFTQVTIDKIELAPLIEKKSKRPEKQKQEAKKTVKKATLKEEKKRVKKTTKKEQTVEGKAKKEVKKKEVKKKEVKKKEPVSRETRRKRTTTQKKTK